MTSRVAIIADDLTGALDTGTPFVQAGLSVAVAIDVETAEEALSAVTDVVIVNTASRALSEEEAAGRVRQVAERLSALRPAIILKKIDSRLKGNVAAETAAIADVLGRPRIVVAPAIPDQERTTLGGFVVGRGVEKPIAVADLFAGRYMDVVVEDAVSDPDLDAIARGHDWTCVLAVGARGLGAALARMLGRADEQPPSFEASNRTLFAFGSRDPITAAQMRSLEATGALRAIIDAQMGSVEGTDGLALPILLRCTGDMAGEGASVARRFAAGVGSVIDETRPDMVMVGGGDTALAFFRELGIRTLMPKGEIEAGIPWVDVTTADGRHFRCSVKSGGFGNTKSLLRLIPRNQSA